MFTLIKVLVLVVSHRPICVDTGGKEFTAHPSVLAVKEPIWCLNRFTPVADGLLMKLLRHMGEKHFSIYIKCAILVESRWNIWNIQGVYKDFVESTRSPQRCVGECNLQRNLGVTLQS